MPKTWISLLILSIFAVAAFFTLFSPTTWAEGKLKRALEQNGIEVKSLNVSDVNWNTLTIENVLIGDDPSLRLSHFEVDFSLLELQKMQLRDVRLSGLELHLKMQDNALIVQGLENVGSDSASENKAPTRLPFTKEDLAVLPFRSITIEKSTLHLESSEITLHIPFAATLQRDDAMLQFAGKNVTGMVGKQPLKAENITLNFKLDDTKTAVWLGKWKVKGGSYPPAEAYIDTQQIEGNARAEPKAISFSTRLQGRMPLNYADIRFIQPLQSDAGGMVELLKAEGRWAGGTIITQDVRIPLNSTQPITLPLTIRQIGLEQVMQEVADGQVSATGTLQGDVRISISRDGQLHNLQGKLSAADTGTLSMPPEALPAQSQSITLIKDILQDFHYDELSLVMDGETGSPAIKLKLFGNNPSVEAGRDVKLNVNFTGDVLKTIQYSILPFANPTDWIKEGT